MVPGSGAPDSFDMSLLSQACGLPGTFVPDKMERGRHFFYQTEGSFIIRCQIPVVALNDFNHGGIKQSVK